MKNSIGENTGHFLNKQETASMLGIGVRTVGNWMKRGRLPFIRLTKRTVRFDRGAVLAHIKNTCTIGATVEVSK